jgi:hypothetical protein
MTYPRPVPEDDESELTLSLLGTAMSAIVTSPVQLVINNVEQQRREVEVRVLSDK